MFTSLALIFLLGLALGSIFEKLHLPKLIGMILTGMILGPYALNMIDGSILGLSSELRKIALVIILTRAGLSLDINDLKRCGRPAFLMCFVPACFEITGMVLIAPKLLGISVLDAAIMGTVVAAVSPAVIVPRMIEIMDGGYGVEKSIPQMILAGASIDDVFVIVLFTAFTGLAKGESVSAFSFIGIPISIVLGSIVGLIIGYILSSIFIKYHMRDTVKVIVILSITFLMVSLEDAIAGIIPFSGLIAIMGIGIGIQRKNQKLSSRISSKYNKLWVVSEIILFVLVGATVDINYAIGAGIKMVILILLVLIFRMIGVYICLLNTNLTQKEKMFCIISYMPKATVQAAIGGVPLAMGLGCGKIVITVAVLAILITAPLGAFGIDKTYKSFLVRKGHISNIA